VFHRHERGYRSCDFIPAKDGSGSIPNDNVRTLKPTDESGSERRFGDSYDDDATAEQLPDYCSLGDIIYAPVEVSKMDPLENYRAPTPLQVLVQEHLAFEEASPASSECVQRTRAPPKVQEHPTSDEASPTSSKPTHRTRVCSNSDINIARC